MTVTLMKCVRAASAITLAAGAGFVMTASAFAQEHREEHGAPHARFEPYHTPHMTYDNRFHHGHYYPAHGYRVNVLPPGYFSLSFGPRHLFYHGGVWWEGRGAGFVVIAPPFGVVVPALPPDTSTIWVGGMPYYYANDVYYAQGPQGYTVVAPPADGSYTEQPPGPPTQAGQTMPPPPQAPQQYNPPMPPAPPGPPAGAPPPAPDKWYFCESANAYYPYVNSCKEGWRAVPAQPMPR
jgi:hypothetical protein